MSNDEIIKEYYRILALFQNSHNMQDRNGAMVEAINLFNNFGNEIPLISTFEE